MFLSVPADGIYNCQQNPEGFGLHRRALFSIWSVDTLQSYLTGQAVEDELNLLTVKYARMEGLIAKCPSSVGIGWSIMFEALGF